MSNAYGVLLGVFEVDALLPSSRASESTHNGNSSIFSEAVHHQGFREGFCFK